MRQRIVTPLEKAKQILADINTFASASSVDLPGHQYAQTGTPVIACAGLIVAVTNVSIAAGYDPTCGAAQSGTFVVTLTRDCGVEFNEDGSDNVDAITAVSAEADADAQMLWDYANQLEIYLTRTWSVSWALIGGLGITTLSLTIGID